MQKHPLKIVYVEDDMSVGKIILRALGMKYASVTHATNGQEGLDAIIASMPDVVITDIRMPVMDGFAMIEEARKLFPDLPFIICSSFSDDLHFIRAIDLGVQHYAVKPFNMRKIFDAIDSINVNLQKEKRIKDQQNIILQMIGRNPNPIMLLHEDRIEMVNESFLLFFCSGSIRCVNEQTPEILGMLRFEQNPEQQFHTIPELRRYLSANRDSFTAVSIGERTFKVESIQCRAQNRCIITFTDISAIEHERQQVAAEALFAKNELEKHKQVLEVLSRFAQMGEMMQAISHQWKQPITMLSMISEVMLDIVNDADIPEQEQMLEHLQQMQGHVQYMVKTMHIYNNFFSPRKHKQIFTIRSILDNIRVLVGKQHIHNNIDISTGGDVDTKIVGYDNELAQALIIVLNNAQDAFLERDIDKNKRKIILQAHHDQSTKTMILTIQDTAGGIAPHALPHIWERFYTTKGALGTGIGLDIVRIIIEGNMGGHVAAHNRDGGACFEIKIPTGEQHVESEA